MNRRKFFSAFDTPALAGAGSVPLTLPALMQSKLVLGVSMLMVEAKGHNAWDEDNQQLVPVFCDDTTLSQVAACCGAYANGLRVNDGHWSSVMEATGFMRNFRIECRQAPRRLEPFETYSQFAHLCQLVVALPDTFGMSIDFDGNPEFGDGKAFARCTKIYSCDLVPTPAANEAQPLQCRSPARRRARRLPQLFRSGF